MRRPVWLGGHNTSELYIEPDVLRPIVPQNSAGGGGELGNGSDHKDAGSASWHTEDVAEVRDLEEPFSSTGLADKEERVSWVELLKKEVRWPGPLAWRYVILGPPGQGKSQLLWMTARQISLLASQSLEENKRSTTEVPLAAVVSIHELVRAPEDDSTPDQELQQALQWVLRRKGCPPEAAAQYIRAARSRRGWLLLDGLDEVPVGDQERLARLLAPLTDISRWPCNVVVTSRSTELWQGRLPFKAEHVLRLAPLSNVQVASYIDRRLNSTARSLADLIQQSPGLVALSRSPFLLSMMCWLAQEGRLSGKSTRSQIYNTLFARLLSVSREGGNGEEQARRGRRFLRVLAKIAWKSFGRDTGRMSLREEELYKALKAEDLMPANGGDDLLGELLHQRVLVPLEPESAEYMFPHRSLLEYLAGWYLSEQVNNHGWQVELDVGTKQVSAVTLVDRKSWDPGWEQVLLFAAGQLQEPLPLLTQLADPKPTLTNPVGDDKFRHRLGLAARCLGEIGNVRREDPNLAELIDRITTELWRLWREHNRIGIHAAIEHLSRSLMPLATMNGRIDGMPLEQFIAQGLGSDDDETKWLSAIAIGHLGSTQATDTLLAKIIDDQNLQWTAYHTLRRLGAAAATDSLMEKLIGMLWSSENKVRANARCYLGVFGAAALTDRLLSELVTLLQFGSEDIRDNVLYTIDEFRTVRVPKSFLLGLTHLLIDDDLPVRKAAVRAVLRLYQNGMAPTCALTLKSLIFCLSNEDRQLTEISAAEAIYELCTDAEAKNQVRLSKRVYRTMKRWLEDAPKYKHDRRRTVAAKVFSRIGPIAPTQCMLNGLMEMLCSKSDDECIAGLEAIEKLCPPEKVECVAVEVARFLNENYRSNQVRRQAVRTFLTLASTDFTAQTASILLFGRRLYKNLEVFGWLGSNAATEGNLSRIATLLGDSEVLVRRYAAKTIGQLGSLAATKAIIDGLSNLLSDSEPSVRSAAVSAFSQLGESAVNKTVLSRIEALLLDEDRDVCVNAAKTIIQFPDASASLAPLTNLLDHKTPVGEALEVLDKLIKSRVNDEFEPTLVRLLAHDDPNVREAAAEAVSKIGAPAASNQVLTRLISLLTPEEYARRAAAEALGKFHEEGNRMFASGERCQVCGKNINELYAIDQI